MTNREFSDELITASNSGVSLATFIEQCNQTDKLVTFLPEIKALQGIQQELKWHPEGDAYQHTICALRASRTASMIVNLCILFHDIGKAPAYKFRHGKHTTYNHDYIGTLLLPPIMERLELPTLNCETIEFVTRKHMLMHRLHELNNRSAYDLVTHPLWNILKDVGYADEMSRGVEADLEKFNEDIKEAEAKSVKFLESRITF